MLQIVASLADNSRGIIYNCNVFRIDLTLLKCEEFSMEFVYSMKIRKTNGCHIYMKQKEGERGKDAGETERESVCVCERGRVAAK
jgi:hypothetical protein